MLDAYVFNTLLNIAIYFYLTKSNIPKNTPSPNTIETRPYTIVILTLSILTSPFFASTPVGLNRTTGPPIGPKGI